VPKQLDLVIVWLDSEDFANELDRVEAVEPIELVEEVLSRLIVRRQRLESTAGCSPCAIRRGAGRAARLDAELEALNVREGNGG
jgi:hypothetical protein